MELPSADEWYLGVLWTPSDLLYILEDPSGAAVYLSACVVSTHATLLLLRAASVAWSRRGSPPARSKTQAEADGSPPRLPAAARVDLEQGDNSVQYTDSQPTQHHGQAAEPSAPPEPELEPEPEPEQQLTVESAMVSRTGVKAGSRTRQRIMRGLIFVGMNGARTRVCCTMQRT